MLVNVSFEDLVEASGWQESDGPFPGVFSDRPAGHKYIASCVWHTEAGPIYPADYAPMAGTEYEEIDALARGELMAMEAKAGRQTVESMRLHYPEFAWQGGGRSKYYRWPRFRPGWPRPAWAPPMTTPKISFYPDGR